VAFKPQEAVKVVIIAAVGEEKEKKRGEKERDKKGMFAFETIILDPTLRPLSQQLPSYKTITRQEITMSQSMFL
jgi:hypothetical protein